MQNTKKIANPRIFLFFGIITCLSAVSLFAQSSIDQATREADRLGKENLEESLPLPPEAPPEIEIKKPSAPEDETKFEIKRILLVGVESFPVEKFSDLLAKYENRETSLSELNQLAKEIEQEYLKWGIIAAVFVPPQEIKEGIITLQVIEAKMGDLQIDEHKYHKKERLSYYWKIPKGETLRYEKISKSLELMNKNPDRQVRSVLHAGKEPGTSDVLLSPTTHFPLHFTNSFDNEGAITTGRSRMGLGGRHNNFLGFDDMLILGDTFGKDFESRYAYHTLPVGDNGVSLLYGYSYSVAEPKKDQTISEIESNAQNFTFSVHQDLFNDEGQRQGEIFTGFDAKDKTITTKDGTNNRDRLRIFSGGFSWTWQTVRSSLYIKPAFYQGVNGLGARRETALSSRNAGNTFSKLTLNSNYKYTLPWHLQSLIKLNGQLCNEKLTPQEEFYMGGIDSVRGYPSGDFLADNALQTNLELLIPAFFIPAKLKLPFDQNALKDQITFVTFYDYSYGIKRNPENTEGYSANFMSLGGGMRIRLYGKALLRLEWGVPIADRTITESSKSRFHFSVDNQF